MEIRLLTHRPEAGWSSALPAELHSVRTLVAVFAATPYADRPDFWEALAAAFPRSRLIACSSAGEIAGGHVADDSAVVVVARFEHVDVVSAAVPIQAVEMSEHAGVKLGRVLAPTAPRAVIVFADGLQVPALDFLKGLAAELPAGTLNARQPPASSNAIATVCASVPPKPAPWPAARARIKTAAASTPAHAPPKRRASQKTNSTVAPANTAATSGATGTSSARPRPPDPPA